MAFHLKHLLHLHHPYAAVYAVVKKIPRGKVATYGQIALLAGLPRAARQVGLALRITPGSIKIPWHRVINAQGQISMRQHDWQSGGDDYQRALLENEGIEFNAAGKINLKKFRWLPPSSPSLEMPCS